VHGKESTVSERIMAVVPLVRKPKSLGRSDTYTLVATDCRMIFAELTGNMLKDAAVEAQRKGTEEGKGFFARWGDQIKATVTYTERYWQIAPDDALSENPKNFAVPNSSVKKIKVSSKDDAGRSDDVSRSYTELKIEASGGKYEFRVDGDVKSVREALKGVFGDTVH
jgi:hypothetical protein